MIEHHGPEPSDEELVAATRRGNDEAFGILFERHQGTAIRVARRNGPPDDAPDVVADVFTAVLALVRRGAGPSDDVRAYLLASVRHEVMRRARRARRQVPTDSLAVLDRASHDADVAEQDSVRRALGTLNHRQRSVLWALEVEGYRPREIAAVTGWESNTVSAMAYRARRAIRKAYDDLTA